MSQHLTHNRAFSHSTESFTLITQMVKMVGAISWLHDYLPSQLRSFLDFFYMKDLCSLKQMTKK